MIENVLVGLSFLVLSFLVAKTFAPDVKSSAETQSVSQVVGPYTMSMANSTVATVGIVPTNTQAIYTGSNNITVTNTCSAGASITMTTNSTSSNSLVRTGSDSGMKEIVATSSLALDNYSWGYALNNTNDYHAVPKKGSANPAIIYNASTAQATSLEIPVKFGVKTDANLPSGRYTTDVVYSMSPKNGCLSYTVTWDFNGGTKKTDATYPTSLNWGQKIDLSALTPTRDGYVFAGWDNGTTTFNYDAGETNPNSNSALSITMTAKWEIPQPMQTFSCSTLKNIGDSISLLDSRDGNIYKVKKLADGRCWMVENLRLSGLTVTQPETNVPYGATVVIPESNISDINSSNNSSAVYIDPVYGGYYNFSAATAGYGRDSSTTSGNAPLDICPRNWRLPTGGNGGEFQNLYNKYGSNSKTMMTEANFTFDGFVGNGVVTSRGSYGSYWSSSIYNASSAYAMTFSTGHFSATGTATRNSGYAVRCIMSDAMQNFNPDTLPNVGDSIQLEDVRDGNRYTVKRLADGKVWMTDDLKIINRTINQVDSNISSLSISYAPNSVSDASLFSTDYNTYSAFIGQSFGGYYNFYTATAGWGDDSKTSGSSPQDICPKGWRLPTGGSNSEFVALAQSYNSSFSSLMENVSFKLGGAINNKIMSGQGQSGSYWSSTVSSSKNAYNIFLNSNNLRPVSSYGFTAGLNIRCVAVDSMQDFDPSTLSEGESVRLKDERDNNVYTVKKLADGKVWMTENLAITGKTITSDDSNLPAGTSYQIPNSNIAAFTDTYNTSAAYKQDVDGGFYNFYTATAGWGTETATGNAPKDICPKGWRLPIGGETGEFSALAKTYNTIGLMTDEAGFTLPGVLDMDNDKIINRLETGFYLSSTAEENENGEIYGFYLTRNGFNADDGDYKSSGNSIRCVAKNETMQEFDKSSLANVGDSRQLEDARDGSMYTVKKLADGKVWMTENLKITGRTITSENSNLPAGTSYKIPNSDIAAFTNAYNTDAAYVDPDEGGFYNFYTATAGWGTNKVSSANSPKDICPKGWQLPTGGSSNYQLNQLYNKYNTVDLITGDPGFRYSGYVVNGALSGKGTAGRYWSSRSQSTNNAFRLYFTTSQYNATSSYNKYYGYTIHCVAV